MSVNIAPGSCMAPRSCPPILLFTDLDGTLLDHFSYSWEPAQEALHVLKEHGIPVIINSSKTFAECRDLQRQLGIDTPFIFENGAGVAIPRQLFPAPSVGEEVEGFWLQPLSTPYSDVTAILRDLQIASGFKYRGFHSMTQSEIAELTGLPQDAAQRASQRRFDEPLVWQDSEARWLEFTEALRAKGLCHTRGGRFVHVMGPADKGKAMLWLADFYGTPPPRLVALGDSENDLPMLRAADMAVVVRSPDHAVPEVSLDQRPPGFVVTEECGPTGWNSAVIKIMKELDNG